MAMAMPCWPPAPALRAPAHWFGTSCMTYSARRTLQCTACMPVRYRLHAACMHVCDLQRTTCSKVACMLAARICAASISAVVPRSVRFSVACLLQGACDPSRSMFPLRARATRARGVPQPFRASEGSPLAAGAGERNHETPKGPSVLGGRESCRVHAARRAAR